MKERKLFLRWALFNGFIITAAIILGFYAHIHITGASLLVTPFILVLAVGSTIYSGILFWRADDVETPLQASALAHKAEHIFFSVALLQLLGLVGAQIGVYVISQQNSSAGVQEATHNVLSGLGAGLTATIFGVLCSVILGIEHHILVHKLESIE